MLLHARMRIGAGQQAREHHALDAEILGVLRLARDLGDDIVRDEILSQAAYAPWWISSRLPAARMMAFR